MPELLARGENESFYLNNFNELGLAETLLRAVSAEGYTNPTPIQQAVIPALLSGQDVLGIAQTGTGKTAAFVLPLLHRINQQRTKPAAKNCGALILAPTRELAAQIADSVRAYGQFMNPSVAVVVGGVKPGKQIKALAPGVDIIVATPGRLLDHLSSGVLRLDGTETIILDEADQMLDLGFVPAIRRIMAKLPKKRQTVLLSATMPKQIRSLAKDFLKHPKEISVAPTSRPIERINQTVVHVDRPFKAGVLIDILSAKDVERSIVFTRTKRGADKITQKLQKAGIPAAAIHGNKSQPQRQRALDAFRNGSVPILVATDIAARGIDVDDVSHVVNYELPNVSESYVHRIGRTARAGKSGIAISLCDASEVELLSDIEKLIGRPLDVSQGLAKNEPATARQQKSGQSVKPKPVKNREGHPKNSLKFRPKRETVKADYPGEKRPGSDAPTAGLFRMLGKDGETPKRVSASIK